MSIRALNQLLGRSTIDPAVAAAYEQGDFDEILADYDFTPEVRRKLKELDPDTFGEFAALALDLVLSIESDSVLARFHDPRQGLCVGDIVGDEEQAA